MVKQRSSSMAIDFERPITFENTNTAIKAERRYCHEEISYNLSNNGNAVADDPLFVPGAGSD
jgi:hypothetical protein